MADVAVLVPVMRRPRNAAPFMTSLAASLEGARHQANVYAIADNDDQATRAAWLLAGAAVLVTEDFGTSQDTRRPGRFAEKVNAGYQYTSRRSQEQWLFLTGDDVRFHTGWLDEALHVADTTSAAVIGTNDLGNPRVTRGDHGTHLLISRTYIESFGASWDGPDVLAHEGYGHSYVDDEIVTAARDRGVWAHAPHSIVEHLHPEFGKGPDDEVYQLGRATLLADGNLFIKRREISRA